MTVCFGVVRGTFWKLAAAAAAAAATAAAAAGAGGPGAAAPAGKQPRYNMFLGYVLAACGSSLKATKVAEAGSGAISSRDREGMSSLGETCH